MIHLILAGEQEDANQNVDATDDSAVDISLDNVTNGMRLLFIVNRMLM